MVRKIPKTCNSILCFRISVELLVRMVKGFVVSKIGQLEGNRRILGHEQLRSYIHTSLIKFA